MKTSEDLNYWIKYSKNTSILAKTVLAVFSIGILIALVTNLGAGKTPWGLLL